jgi:DNA-binding FadR family transcriptional regulator
VVGDPIPSTAVLVGRHGVSTTVVRKAIELLRAEGSVLSQPGKAVYVIATPEQAAVQRQPWRNWRVRWLNSAPSWRRCGNALTP